VTFWKFLELGGLLVSQLPCCRPPNQRSENLGFLKTQPSGFWCFIPFLGLLGFLIFYLNERLGSLLVDLAHQLSFYLDSPVL